MRTIGPYVLGIALAVAAIAGVHSFAPRDLAVPGGLRSHSAQATAKRAQSKQTPRKRVNGSSRQQNLLI
jgi:hypothetical protein